MQSNSALRSTAQVVLPAVNRWQQICLTASYVHTAVCIENHIMQETTRHDRAAWIWSAAD